MSFLFALLSVIAPAQAGQQSPRTPVPWADVTNPGIYYLTQDLKINDHVEFSQSAKFNFVEVMGGGGYVPVTFFELRPMVCPDPEATEDLFLINPTGRNGEEIGVKMEKNCQITFFVEDSMVGVPSLFTDSAE